MSVPWFGLQCWKCFLSVSSRHRQCYTWSAVDNAYGSKVMKLSLEKIAAAVRMWEHLLGLPAWLAKLESPQAGDLKDHSSVVSLHSTRVCLICWCMLPASHLSRIQSLFRRGFILLQPACWGGNAKFFKVQCCNVRRFLC